MAIMLDADVIIAGERGILDLKGWIDSIPNQPLELAAVTVAELWHGVERAAGRQKSARGNYLAKLIQAMPVIPYTKATAFEHARLWAELEAVGNRIGYYDLIVAATALERGSAVATFNTRHFSQVKGLTIIKPS